MKKILTIIAGLFMVVSLRAQDKDTFEVQKIGDKYFVIMDHKDPDTTRYMPLDHHKKFDEHFMVVGLTTVGFNQQWITTSSTLGMVSNQKSKTNTIGDPDNFEFSPMLLWRHGDKFLMEFEPSFTAGGIGVNWADVHYFVAPGLIIRAGYMVLPFGTYSKRLAAGWINKFGYDPVGATSAPVGSDWGVAIGGGAQAGKMKVNYDLCLANGFNVGNDGQVTNPGIVANANMAKTVCGRFGWLPIPNSSLEIGISGLYSKVGMNRTSSPDSAHNGSVIMGAADLQYIYAKNPIQITIKGQYNMSYVTNFTYTNPNDGTDFTFTNKSYGYYGMLALRPVVTNKILRNFEIAGRYSAYQTPVGSGWESNTRQIDVALDYWINWRTVIKLCYENLLQTNPANGTLVPTDNRTLSHILQVQFSIQL